MTLQQNHQCGITGLDQCVILLKPNLFEHIFKTFKYIL